MKERDERRLGCAWVVMAHFAAFAIIALLTCSCTTTRYVPVESVRTEYKEADTTAIYNRLMRMFESMREKEVRKDSLIDRQKETFVVNENGDTTRHDRERIVYRSTNREKELEHKVSTQESIINALRLQLASVKTDSIAVPYPVEKSLTRWQRVKMDFGGLGLGAVGAVLIWIVVGALMKLRGKK